MAILPPVKRFSAEDYSGMKSIQDFVGKFFSPMNLFLNATYSALSNGLTINANSLGLVKTVTNVVSDANGLASTTINWPYLQSPPVGVAVTACTISTDRTLFPLISWSYSSGVITISMQFVKVSGGALVASTSETYSVGFWVTGG